MAGGAGTRAGDLGRSEVVCRGVGQRKGTRVESGLQPGTPVWGQVEVEASAFQLPVTDRVSFAPLLGTRGLPMCQAFLPPTSPSYPRLSTAWGH